MLLWGVTALNSTNKNISYGGTPWLILTDEDIQKIKNILKDDFDPNDSKFEIYSVGENTTLFTMKRETEDTFYLKYPIFHFYDRNWVIEVPVAGLLKTEISKLLTTLDHYLETSTLLETEFRLGIGKGITVKSPNGTNPATFILDLRIPESVTDEDLLLRYQIRK